MHSTEAANVLEFKRPPTPLKRIRIRMRGSFREFDDSKKREFLEDLSELLGLEASDLQRVVFRRGCIIFEADLNREAAEKLLEMSKKLGAEALEELRDYETFHEKNNVTDVTDELVYSFQIIARRKSEVAAKDHVVFIHGWRGDEDSFGQLPKMIQNKLDCRCVVYDYPTGVWRHSPSVAYVSGNLENWIRNFIRSERIALVAHSMGGIVARRLVVSQSWRSDPLDKRIKQMTFIASPYNGAVLAALAKKVPTFRKGQLQDITPSSSFLFDLNQQWDRWSQENVPNNCSVRSIFGTADDVVSSNNARGLDPEAIPILGADHRSIVKPESSSDEIVATLARLLEEAGISKPTPEAANPAVQRTTGGTGR